MKKLILLLIVLIVIVAIGAGVALLQKETFVEGKIQTLLESITGTEVKMMGFQMDAWGESIQIKKIEIRNPEGFSAVNLAQISRIQIQMHPDLMKRLKGHIVLLQANVEHLSAEKTAAGKMNLKSLKALSEEVLDRKIPMPVGPGFFIQRLELIYETMNYGQWNREREEMETIATPLRGQKSVYDGITSPYVLIQAPISKAITTINQGSLGLPRGKIGQNIRAFIGKKTPAS